MLDKNFMSFFHFLHVLPGAWSFYRYEALAVGAVYRENLIQKKYLKTALDPDAEERDYREANMFLAEDRILCLGIVT
jgi:chitin synthase